MPNWFIPSKGIFTPELLVPGEKPVGPVKINRRNTYGAHIVAAFVPQSGPFDVAKNEVLTLTSGASIKNNLAVFDNTAGNRMDYARPCEVVTEVTVIAKIRRTAASLDGVFSDKNSGNWGTTEGLSLSARSSVTGAFFYFGDGYTYNDDTSIGLNTWYVLAGLGSVGAVPEIYINGQFITATATVSTTAMVESESNCRVGNYHNNAKDFSGDIEYVFALNKKLSPGRLRQLIKNPYQVLEPAGPEWLPINMPSAETGPVFPNTRRFQHILVR